MTIEPWTRKISGHTHQSFKKDSFPDTVQFCVELWSFLASLAGPPYLTDESQCLITATNYGKLTPLSRIPGTMTMQEM